MMINVLTLQGENCCCSLLGPNTLYDNSQLTTHNHVEKMSSNYCLLPEQARDDPEQLYFPILG